MISSRSANCLVSVATCLFNLSISDKSSIDPGKFDLEPSGDVAASLTLLSFKIRSDKDTGDVSSWFEVEEFNDDALFSYPLILSNNDIEVEASLDVSFGDSFSTVWSIDNFFGEVDFGDEVGVDARVMKLVLLFNGA